MTSWTWSPPTREYKGYTIEIRGFQTSAFIYVGRQLVWETVPQTDVDAAFATAQQWIDEQQKKEEENV